MIDYRPRNDIPGAIHEKFLKPNFVKVDAEIGSGLSGSLIFRGSSPAGPVCLRGWPPASVSAKRLHELRCLVELTHSHRCHLLPGYLSGENGEFFVSARGRFWELTEWMPGIADYQAHPSDARLESALGSLALLHRVWSVSTIMAPSPAVETRITRLSRWLQKDWSPAMNPHRTPTLEAHGRIEIGQLPALFNDTLEALQKHGMQILNLLDAINAPRVRQHWVLRDIWGDHVLFSGDEVTGIVDLGAARIDEPATDLSRLLGSLEPRAVGRWQQGLRTYQNLQPMVDPLRVVVLDYASCLISALQWFEWLAIEGRTFSVPTQELLKRWRGFLQRLGTVPWTELLDWARANPARS